MILRNKKNRYYVIFVKKEHGVFKRLSKRKIRPTTNKIRRRKHTYFINLGFPTYSRGLKVFYFIDTSAGQLVASATEFKNKQILFKGNTKDVLLSPKTLDMLVSQNIVSQLTSNLSDNAIKMNIIAVVLGLIIGVLSGYIFAGYV